MASIATEPQRDGIVGNYVLHRRLAVGGMAEIFEARRQTGDTDERLVLKMLLPQHQADAEFARGLEYEAKLNIALAHPNLIRVYELAHHDGQPFIAMELVDGVSVQELLAHLSRAKQRLPVDAALWIIESTLKALQHVHAATDEDGRQLDVIHRDVTPHNILINLDGEVKLGDFGIARSNLKNTRTRTGVIKGKLRYMAPEQVTGSSMDRRTDLYAVGLILWELLAGHPYIEGSREIDLLRAAESPRFHRPSSYEGITAKLDQVLERCLARFPEERFPNAQELQSAIERALPLERNEATSATLGTLVQETRDDAAPARAEDETLTADSQPGGELYRHERAPREVSHKRNALDATLAASTLDGDARPQKRSSKDKTSTLLGLLVIALFSAWLGPRLIESDSTEPATPTSQSLPQVMRGPPSLLPAEGDASTATALTESVASAALPPPPSPSGPEPDRASQHRGRPAATPTGSPRGVSRESPSPSEAIALAPEGAAVDSPQEPIESEPSQAAPDSPSRLLAEVQRLRSALSTQGIQLADLRASERSAYQRVLRLVEAGELSAAERELPTLQATFRSISVDAQFVQRKINRVDRRIDQARAAGTDTSSLTGRARLALQDFLSGRYDSSNRRLNQILAQLGTTPR